MKSPLMAGLLVALLCLPCLPCLPGCATSAPHSSVDDLIKANLNREKGNLDLAMLQMTRAIEKNPKLGLAYVGRGEIFKQKGDYESAAQDFEKATKIEPYNFNAHYQLGLMYQYLKKFEQSLKAYQKAVEIRPLDTNANMNLALVYTQMGDPQRGLSFAQRAVNGGPDNAMAHANLGVLYAQLGYGDLAVDEFKKSIELNAKESAVYLNLANEYLKANKLEQARQVLETGKALANSPAVCERLGYIYYKQHDLGKAGENFRDALKQNPSYYQALNGMGVIAMSAALTRQPADVRQAKEALGYWQRSLQVEPNQPVIRQLVDKYSGSTTQAAG